MNEPTAAQILDREGEPCKSFACNYEDPHNHGPACGRACACGASMQRNLAGPYHERQPLSAEPILRDDRNIAEPPAHRREVVTLCGSTRFRAEFDAADEQLTLAGFIVLRPGVWGHSKPVPMDDATKAELDRLHLAKIDMSDRVVVICPGRYIGESTLREIFHATKVGKVIEYREAKQVERPQIRGVAMSGGIAGPGVGGALGGITINGPLDPPPAAAAAMIHRERGMRQ